ncbi:MAG TPA: helix-turn-helix domain-containing protein [Solirubrobacteraceae bacterium]|nr:helix-turn-helix domain-containing protein [Solirubrobacteraceae bacterium]
MPAKPRRPYRQVARAEATERTREALLAAADEEFTIDGFTRASLEAVADRAGVTKQTALRHFGSKHGLIEALLGRTSELVERERAKAAPGDVRGAVRALVRHYENWGEGVLRMLAEEHRVRIVHHVADHGREVHRDWVLRTFEPQLAPLVPSARRRRVAQLVAVCDVYTWKLLRQDMAMEVAETEAALVELLERLLAGA